MKSTTKKFAAFALGLLLSCPWQTFGQTPSLRDLRAQQQAAKPSKLAPDLEELLADDDEEQRQALAGKTLSQVRQERRTRANQRAQEEGKTAPQRTRIGNTLLPSSEVLADEKQSFIVQFDRTTPEIVLQEKLARLGGRLTQSLNGLGLMVIEAPRTAIRQIAADNSISYTSPDRPIVATGHLETTTGAAQIRNNGLLSTLDGSGIGIAVIDSGVDQVHALYDSGLLWTSVKYAKDFSTGELNGTNDPYGHGTHVAGLLAGDVSLGIPFYHGIAPAANLLNLRVLDREGRGTTAQVIAALAWCVLNKSQYNIRVINLSLGTMAKDSYRTDPLCLAARAAVNAGIVVVAAAGNEGKDSNGKKIYGGIHSPGNDPSVITVGASNTFGTDSRADDVVTTYSSRGPTRSYSVVNGVRKYDNLIKPDLVAPGNKLISAAAGSAGNTLLSNTPVLRTLPLPALGENGMMYMSGTSMSTPIVSGAAALMLEANPNLTPNLIKAILMYTAQPLKGFNMLEQGAGLLNIDGAVRVAKLIRSPLPTTNGAALLTAALPTQQSTVAGTTFKWGQGVITNFGFLTGSALMTQWQGVYGLGQMLGDATTYSSGTLKFVSGKTSTGVSLKAGAVQINGSGIILGDSVNTIFASGQVLGDGIILGDGTILGDGIILGDGVVLSDGTTRADTTLRSLTALLGDNTACMQPPQ